MRLQVDDIYEVTKEFTSYLNPKEYRKYLGQSEYPAGITFRLVKLEKKTPYSKYEACFILRKNGGEELEAIRLIGGGDWFNKENILNLKNLTEEKENENTLKPRVGRDFPELHDSTIRRDVLSDDRLQISNSWEFRDGLQSNGTVPSLSTPEGWETLQFPSDNSSRDDDNGDREDSSSSS